jgi:VanZ family protein
MVALWAGLIFVLSAQANLRFVTDDGLDIMIRKLGHLAVFGMLALLLWRALATVPHRDRWALALAFTVIYAATDELHQAFVVGRHPSAADVAIDAIGALIAVALVGLAGAGRTRRRASP